MAPNPSQKPGQLDSTIKVGRSPPHALRVDIFFIAWLDLMHYFIHAYKTGGYPRITKDRAFLWGRLYPVQADAPDPIGKPTNYDWVYDRFLIKFLY